MQIDGEPWMQPPAEVRQEILLFSLNSIWYILPFKGIFNWPHFNLVSRVSRGWFYSSAQSVSSKLPKAFAMVKSFFTSLGDKVILICKVLRLTLLWTLRIFAVIHQENGLPCWARSKPNFTRFFRTKTGPNNGE